MRDLDEMKLAFVIDASGGIDGRVKMQKIVYLLKALGYDLPFNDFWIRQHGPFSRAVACSADLLTAAGFVKESRDTIPGQGGETVERYSYTVSDSIKPLLNKHFGIKTPKGKAKIEEIATKLKQRERAVLEVAATKMYLQREDKLKGQALEKELKRLKGHLSGSFNDADSLLAELGLVRSK